MSKTQKSSATLEPVVSRSTFPLHTRSGVCRNLFGPVDHGELNRDLKAALQEMADRDRRRWNFNFETDTPLSGVYDWEEIPMDATPVFYRDSFRIGKTGNTVAVKEKPCVDVAQDDFPVQDVQVYCPIMDRLSDFEDVRPNSGEVNQNNCSDKINSEKLQFKSLTCKRTTTVVFAASTTARITDYYGKRRKTSDVKPNEHTLQYPAQPISVERTPRKRLR